MSNIIKNATYNYDYLNPLKGDNPDWDYIPGFRGADQLNIYTYDYLLKTKDNKTGTNPWGSEAAVNKNNIVIEINDRVNIPKGGYVISGNQIGEKFIKENIEIGSKITLDINNKLIIVSTNKIKSKYLTISNKYRLAKSLYNKAINNAYKIDKVRIDKHFKEFENCKKALNKYSLRKVLSTKEKRDVNYKYKKAIKCFDIIYLLTSPSSRVVSRNVWTRPHEQSLQEIINTLETCKRLNINGLYVESFYNGDIPGISNITETNEEVINGYYGEEYKNDYLKALISEAHKRNIEIHAWVECFFVGERSNQWKDRYKDSWHMVNYDYSTIQGNNDEGNEKDFVFLDPANPECLAYVLSIYEELISKYEFDGINVDYIRYPHGNFNLYSSNGYSEYAMNEFKQIYNLSGDVRELVKDKEIFKLWTEYRCSKITKLMEETRKLVKRIRPNCFISTAVCSDINYAINNKMQNWEIWAKQGWLDLTLPMAYYIGCSEIAVATKELVDFNKGKAYSYTGIMCAMKELPGDLIIKQINTLLDNNADGYAFFHLGDILNRKEVQHNLKLSVNRYQSVHPHCNSNVIINYFVKELIERKPFFKNDITDVINNIKKIINLPLKEKIAQLKAINKNVENKSLKKDINKIIYYLKVKKYQKSEA